MSVVIKSIVQLFLASHSSIVYRLLYLIEFYSTNFAKSVVFASLPGDFKWIDGSSSLTNYTTWYTRHPYQHSFKKCVTFAGNFDAHWYNQPCELIMGFAYVCKSKSGK